VSTVRARRLDRLGRFYGYAGASECDDRAYGLPQPQLALAGWSGPSVAHSSAEAPTFEAREAVEVLLRVRLIGCGVVGRVDLLGEILTLALVPSGQPSMEALEHASSLLLERDGDLTDALAAAVPERHLGEALEWDSHRAEEGGERGRMRA
jgi:hypothetical protein